jgi:hypothetical protein
MRLHGDESWESGTRRTHLSWAASVSVAIADGCHTHLHPARLKEHAKGLHSTLSQRHLTSHASHRHYVTNKYKYHTKFMSRTSHSPTYCSLPVTISIGADRRNFLLIYPAQYSFQRVLSLNFELDSSSFTFHMPGKPRRAACDFPSASCYTHNES